MGTRVYHSEDDFLKRQDPSENGVSAAFAAINPHYSEQNLNNRGCWNCRDCSNCVECRNCVNCHGCKLCIACNDSKNCRDCRHCEHCYNCINCNSSNNCNNCIDCSAAVNCYDCNNCNHSIDCVTCLGCDNCSNCSHCNYCNECSDCNYTNKGYHRKSISLQRALMHDSDKVEPTTLEELQRAGFDSFTHLADVTGETETLLINWSRQYPRRFALLIAGIAAQGQTASAPSDG